MAALNLYDQFRLKQIRGNTGLADIETLTLKMAIVTSVYTVDQNLHDFWADAAAAEVSGTNYTADGNAMANEAVTISGAGLVKWDADDPAAWLQHASGFSNGRAAIIYDDDGVDATSKLFLYSADFGADKGNVAGDLTITIDAAGIFTSAR